MGADKSPREIWQKPVVKMKLMLKLVVSVLLLSSATLAEKARYDNYRVYSLSVETKEQLEVLQAIEEYPDGVSA
jgi:hypothetical protein